MMRKYFILLFPLFLISCGEAKNNEQKTIDQVDTSSKVEDLKLPSIPMTIVDPMERASYLTRHYWDSLVLNPVRVEDDSIRIEQYFSNYLAVLNESNRSNMSENIRRSLKEIVSDSLYLSLFNYIADKYLYDPNSPFRNDEVYLIFVDEFRNNSKLSYADKERLNFKYKLLQKNRIGEKAEEFRFKTDKESSTLSQVKGDIILLYFNNPGCHACEEVQGQLQASALLQSHLKTGHLTILSVYPDEDLEEWRRFQSKQPANWINAYDPDQQIKRNLLYDLKAIPSLYLLDGNKKVLLKDATVQQIESFIYEN